jgi:hypothetical protein
MKMSLPDEVRFAFKSLWRSLAIDEAAVSAAAPSSLSTDTVNSTVSSILRDQKNRQITNISLDFIGSSHLPQNTQSIGSIFNRLAFVVL